MDVVYALKRNGYTLYGYGDCFPRTRAQRIAKLKKQVPVVETEGSSQDSACEVTSETIDIVQVRREAGGSW